MKYIKLIKHLRAQLNLSQSQLAEKIDYSVRTVQDWEQGRLKPSRRAMKAINRLALKNDKDLI